MITGIITAIVTVFQLFSLAIRVIALTFKASVTILGWIVNIAQFLTVNIAWVLTWFAGWMGPLASSIKWALSPEELKRAATLAFGVATVLWLIFSTIFNDFFYVMINPFFLNLFTTLGHLGFSLVAGLFTFIVDAIRRLFHGPTKLDHLLILKWNEDLEREKIAKAVDDTA